jgi:hypothetical protein
MQRWRPPSTSIVQSPLVSGTSNRSLITTREQRAVVLNAMPVINRTLEASGLPTLPDIATLGRVLRGEPEVVGYDGPEPRVQGFRLNGQERNPKVNNAYRRRSPGHRTD